MAKLKIVLTGRRPVNVDCEVWPNFARGTGDNWSGGPDGARHRQAELQGELTTYAVRVRRHADGRAIVYATLEDPYTVSNDRAGGVILAAPSSEELVAAIRRVGASCNVPESVILACVADLPAEELE